eukprot:4158993-Amphidinium_carterae.1
MGAMGGKDEYRCDLIESPSQYELVCEVSAGTPAGYYQLNYILEDAVRTHWVDLSPVSSP